MRPVFMTAAAAVFGAVAGPTLAADPSYSFKSIEESRRIAYAYGKCIVHSRAASASKALLLNVDNQTLKKRYPVLINGECLSPGMTAAFAGDVYRYALADGLFARELATTPVPDLSKVPPLEHALVPKPALPPLISNKRGNARYQWALREAQQEEVFRQLSIYGECVVRASPSNAKALLMSEPESAAEPARFAALQPALTQCMPADQTMTLSKLVLRGAIAVNYYRLAKAALRLPMQ